MRPRTPSNSGMDAFSTTIDFTGAAMAAPSSARHLNHVTAAKEPPHARAPHAGRMTCLGRSPGSRVIILLRLPGPCRKSPVAFSKKDSPPTVAGAASDLVRYRQRANRTEFPLLIDVTSSPERKQLKLSPTSCQDRETLRFARSGLECLRTRARSRRLLV